MTAVHFDSLPWAQRHAIVDDVARRCAETPGHDLDDIVRWTVDAYVERVQDDLVADAVAKAEDKAAEGAWWDGYAAGQVATEAVW